MDLCNISHLARQDPAAKLSSKRLDGGAIYRPLMNVTNTDKQKDNSFLSLRKPNFRQRPLIRRKKMVIGIHAIRLEEEQRRRIALLGSIPKRCLSSTLFSLLGTGERSRWKPMSAKWPSVIYIMGEKMRRGKGERGEGEIHYNKISTSIKYVILI